MTPAQECKAAGLKSLNELAEITGKSVSTLAHWQRTQRKLWRVVLAGAVARRASDAEA